LQGIWSTYKGGKPAAERQSLRSKSDRAWDRQCV